MFAFQVHLSLIWKWGSGVFFLLRGLDFVGVGKVGGKTPCVVCGKEPPLLDCTRTRDHGTPSSFVCLKMGI